MHLQQSKDLAHKAGRTLKKASPTIMTCIGAIGVVVTAVLAVKAAPKATNILDEAKKRREDNLSNEGEKSSDLPIKEKVALTWTCYIPTTIAGITTICFIFGANVLNQRQQASLISAYALLDQSYRNYKRSVQNVFGEEGHKNVLEDMSVQKVDPDHTITVIGAFENSTIDFNIPEEEHLFYDVFSDRHFTSTIGKVLQAEYHINRTFMINGCVTLNDFYSFLGLDEIEGGDKIGWEVDYDNEFYWIDFNHSVSYLDDGVDRPQIECLMIEFPIQPSIPYSE